MESVPAPAPALTPATGWQRLRAYRLLLGLAALTFALDQATKAWIAARLPYGTYAGPGAIAVVPDFFYLIHVGNTGAAWSVLTGQSMLLALLAVGTLGAIFLWRRALGLRTPVVQVSFGLLCGGIAGNLLDRIRHGHVIDFIDLHFGSYIYPTFNIADSGICVGVVIYLWHSLRGPA
ncbi:MAG TPA: signal peptidase II, partial [Opitutaceae bacterium]|nr:signal peptidase II [Opitutaceae bacterium]